MSRYLTIPEVAARCGGVDRSRVYIWIKRGVTVRGCAGRFYLRATRVPSGMRVEERELERFLAELQGEPLTPPSPRATRGEGASDQDLVVVADGITIFDGRPRGPRVSGGCAVRTAAPRGKSPGHRRCALRTAALVTPG